ncbi:type II toxin-antitoxin system VapC family toxin [Methanosarcina sp.]|uniref:type II toxin-antitoxin system VapC family toxin n=1 Tax=Methanosarcina sp. TaxID=2213 RepID=UPI002ABBED06|nr:type II toxin-antitoxin system VapC family toxin [Methanosarcina sp.]MDY9927780.1 type II toxin-antitoxin system VapC family toxin [Methanosarcina sp.]
MIVIDTSALIDFFRGVENTREFMDNDVTTTVITYYEILSGIKHRKARKEEHFFRRFFSEIDILDFDLKAAEEASDIMGRLLSLGIPVNSTDVLIAGIAIVNGAEKIVSRDKDFISIGKVSNLDVLVY